MLLRVDHIFIRKHSVYYQISDNGTKQQNCIEIWLLDDGLGSEPSQLTVSSHLLSDLNLWPIQNS